MKFYNKLQQRWHCAESFLCVGLDSDISQLPEHLGKDEQGLLRFNREIIDEVATYACAFKLQIAYYAAYGVERVLEQTIDYIQRCYPDIPIILDAKRGDIGATAAMYAKEAFERYQADAVTVNPYMGGDSLRPFLDYADKGVFILCRTSNAGGSDLQESQVYQKVANLSTNEWNYNKNIGLVVGGTYPEVIAEIRTMVDRMPLLVPGVGVQGGDLDSVMRLGVTNDKQGLVINASRSIIYASRDEDFAQAAAVQAKRLADQMKIFINQ